MLNFISDLKYKFYIKYSTKNKPASAMFSTKFASSIESPASARQNLMPSALNLFTASSKVMKFPSDLDIYYK